MIRHGPTCLDGPVTKQRAWWAAPLLGGAAGRVTEGEMRPDLVRRVRAEIAAGTYDTPEKLDIALGRLIDRLGRE